MIAVAACMVPANTSRAQTVSVIDNNNGLAGFWPSLPGNPVVLGNSTVHFPEPPTVPLAHCFSDSALVNMLSQQDYDIVIHHGKELPESENRGYVHIPSHYESLPVFVNRETGIENLSGENLRKILSGEVNNWKELGGTDLPIRIYTQNQAAKASALDWQLTNAGTPVTTGRAGEGDYAYLATMAVKDPGAMVLGLRSQLIDENFYERAVGILPVKQDGSPLYSMPVHLYVKDGSQNANDAARRLLERISQEAGYDGLVYPLADKMQALD